MKRTFPGLLLAVFLCFMVMPDAHAASYRYTDKDGNVGIADDIGSVPAEYRATAERIGADDLEEKQTTGLVVQKKATTPAAPPAGNLTQTPVIVTAPAPQGPVASVPAPDPEPDPFRSPFSRRGQISLGAVAGVVLLAVLLGRISALRVRHGALNAVRMSLFAILLAYLAVAHYRDILVLLRMAGGKVSDVSDRSAKRGEKAGKAIKEIQALGDQVDEAAKQADEAQKGLNAAESPQHPDRD